MGISRRAVTARSFQFRIAVMGAALSSTAVSIDAAHPETGCNAPSEISRPAPTWVREEKRNRWR